MRAIRSPLGLLQTEQSQSLHRSLQDCVPDPSLLYFPSQNMLQGFNIFLVRSPLTTSLSAISIFCIQVQPMHPSASLSKQHQSDRPITSLLLLAALILIQAMMPLAFFGHLDTLTFSFHSSLHLKFLFSPNLLWNSCSAERFF